MLEKSDEQEADSRLPPSLHPPVPFAPLDSIPDARQSETSPEPPRGRRCALLPMVIEALPHREVHRRRRTERARFVLVPRSLGRGQGKSELLLRVSARLDER